MSYTRRLASIAILAVVGLAGCSREVSKEQLEDGVARLLEDQVGQPVASVTCDDNLKAEVNSKVRCTLAAADGSIIGLTVTATSVDGDDVKYKVVVDNEPATGPTTATSATPSR
jgi:hypothetical protein